MGFIFLIIVLGIVGWAVGRAANNSNNSAGEWRCPHGYDEYACNTACPLHHHCAGSGEEDEMYDDDREENGW